MSLSPLLAPLAASAGAIPRRIQVLTATGSAESKTTAALVDGEVAVIKNGTEPLRVVFLGAEAGSNAVANTHPFILAPYEAFPWRVTPETRFVAAEATTANAYSAAVYQASGNLDDGGP